MRIPILIIFITHYLSAQNLKENNCFLKINDSVIAKEGEYVLDKEKIIDLSKTILITKNIKSVESQPTNCSNIHSGHKNIYLVSRKKKNPLLNLCNYVEKIKTENKQTNNFKVFVNDKLINDCYNYFVEISKKTKFLIIKDTILDYKITIRIEQ